MHPGKTRSTTVTLNAGKYMLFCTEARYFKAGMYATFTVERRTRQQGLAADESDLAAAREAGNGPGH